MWQKCGMETLVGCALLTLKTRGRIFVGYWRSCTKQIPLITDYSATLQRITDSLKTS